MPEEERLIVELGNCDSKRIAAQTALSHPEHSMLAEEYNQLAKAAELARGKVDAIRLRLRSLRAAKLRKKDSDDLHKLQNALNALAEEIDTITYASEASKEQPPGPEATAARQQRHQRLGAIRVKLTGLSLVMSAVNPNSPLPDSANERSDIGEALQKLHSAESNLDEVETHLNNTEGANADDKNEIASAKSSASDVEDDLKAAKSALQKAAS